MLLLRRDHSRPPRLLTLVLCSLLALSLTVRVTPAEGASSQPPVPDVGIPQRHRDDVGPTRTLPAASSLVPAESGDYRIDALLSGYRWPESWATVTYSFYDDQVFNGSYYGTATDVHEVSEAVKANVRRIMAWYETLINVDFVEVAETPTEIGYIRFMLTTETNYARAFYPISTALFNEAGDVHLNPNYDRLGDPEGFQHPPGQYGYFILIHEIGHALGLKHPFEGSPALPLAEDHDSNTVMSYTTRGDAPATPMPYDLLALHYLYGMRPHNAGSDTYRFTTRGADQYTLGGELYQDTLYHLRQTLWDSGGLNTLDLSALPYRSDGYRVDLNGLGRICGWSDYGSSGDYYLRGTTLGATVQVGAVLTSASNDTIIASPAANVFGGYGPAQPTGADLIIGPDSADTLDLRSFRRSEVTATQVGNDLVLSFAHGGSVTLKAYFAGNRPTILLGDGAATLLPLVLR